MNKNFEVFIEKQNPIAVVGCGYWGKNLVRNFFAQKNATLKTVVDADQNKLSQINQNYPTIQTTTLFEDVLKDDEIDGVVIATQVFSHFNLAKAALLAGKNVLIEKPMTATYAQAEELINLAKEKNKVLMVDHTFLYTGAVQKMKQVIDNKELGNVNYIDSTRINLGLFQPDVNVLWDLAAHDISICNYLIGENPVSVQATGISHTNNGIENIAYLTLHYASNKIAHFNCSWSSPVKIRQMLVGGDKKMILWNDLDVYEKIKIYDTGYELKSEEDKTKILVDYRIGDIFVPKTDDIEALFAMAKDFISAIQTGSKPRSSFEIGSTVVKVLEASQVSIKNKGVEVGI